MPAYVYTLNIPSGTLDTLPAEIAADLPAGRLRAVTIFFPPGPQGEVGIRVLHNRSTIVPSQESQWLAWDSGAVTVPLDYWLLQNEQQLVIQGQSPRANFDHSVMVKLDLDTAETDTPVGPFVSDLDRVQPSQE